MKQQRTLQWKCRDRTLDVGGRPLVMGILNVTPDSFSDGGKHGDFESAVRCGVRMAEEGADIIDVGGESTRPGAAAVPVEEELARVVPVIRELSRRIAIPLSVDTSKAEVARQGVEAGAVIVNDVTALLGDGGMAGVVRATGAGVVLMHMRGTPRTMQDNPEYGDVAAEVAAFLGKRVEGLVAYGIARDAMAVDPGIGFGKTFEHNLDLIAGLEKLAVLGMPVVAGLSRKSFIGKITGRDAGDRMAGSVSGAVAAMFRGANVLRVHDVRETRDAVLVAWAVMERGRG